MTEAQGKIKDYYTFSQGVNAPCEIFLTGFIGYGPGLFIINNTAFNKLNLTPSLAGKLFRSRFWVMSHGTLLF